jgi:hypothetical protein
MRNLTPERLLAKAMDNMIEKLGLTPVDDLKGLVTTPYEDIDDEPRETKEERRPRRGSQASQ